MQVDSCKSYLPHRLHIVQGPEVIALVVRVGRTKQYCFLTHRGQVRWRNYRNTATKLQTMHKWRRPRAGCVQAFQMFAIILGADQNTRAIMIWDNDTMMIELETLAYIATITWTRVRGANIITKVLAFTCSSSCLAFVKGWNDLRRTSYNSHNAILQL
jgi:hypothetical protein